MNGKVRPVSAILLLLTSVNACAQTETAKPETAKTLSVSAAAGRAKADAVCAACHGRNGYSQLPNAPHLAGQPEIY